MKKPLKAMALIFLTILMAFFLIACSGGSSSKSSEQAAAGISEQEAYTSAEEVAAYLRTYHKLPSNFMTKAEARKKGWDAEKGNLQSIAPNAAIGGDRFGNREGRLPTKKGRIYYECDVNYNGGRRGPERLVFSNDGSIYYSKDHYRTFKDVTKEGP